MFILQPREFGSHVFWKAFFEQVRGYTIDAKISDEDFPMKLFKSPSFGSLLEGSVKLTFEKSLRQQVHNSCLL